MKDCDFSIPKVLADEKTRVLLREKRYQRNVSPLNKWVDRCVQNKNGRKYNIPYFDPNDGGINATALFLLEAPGRQATGSGFISRNNNDGTAANMLAFLQKSGFKREETILWNVVPWYVGNDKKIRAVTSEDHKEARSYLKKLLKYLRKLNVVVLVGKEAQKELRYLQPCPRLKIFFSPHPSPRNVNSRPDCKKTIIDTFRKARLATRRPQNDRGKDAKMAL